MPRALWRNAVATASVGEQPAAAIGEECDARIREIDEQPAEDVDQGGRDPDRAVKAAEDTAEQVVGHAALQHGVHGDVHGGDAQPRMACTTKAVATAHASPVRKFPRC